MLILHHYNINNNFIAIRKLAQGFFQSFNSYSSVCFA